MNPQEIDVSKIELKDNFITYEGTPLVLSVGWMPCYFNQDFNIINVPLNKESPLFAIFSKIDSLVAGVVANGYKQIKILREYTTPEGHLRYSVKPSITYSKFFDTEKRTKALEDLKKLKRIECRFIFNVKKVYKHMKYHGTQLSARQLQFKEMPEPTTECMFE